MNPHGARNVRRLQTITSPQRALNHAKTFTHAASKITMLSAGHPIQSVSAQLHPCDAARKETPNTTRTVASCPMGYVLALSNLRSDYNRCRR